MRHNSFNARKYYKTKAIQTIKSEIDNVEIFIINDNEEKNIFTAMGFRGRCTKRDFYISFKTHDKMFDYIEKYIESRKKVVETKKKYRKENKGLSPAASAAKMIKQILKENFPGIKFSVRSSYFANGNDVSVKYTDGPTTKEVDKLIGKFQYGHFDGMTDMYEYSNNREDIPQAKYVTIQRNISDEKRIKIINHIKETYADYDKYDDNSYEMSTMVYRISSKTSFYNNDKLAEF